MRNLIFLILPFLFIISCNEEKLEEDLEPIDKDSIYGKWQLVEKWDGVLSDPYNVEDGYFYTFNSDSTCSTTHSTIGCKSENNPKVGAYGLYEDEISKLIRMRFICEGKEKTFMPYRYELNDGFLKLTPHEDYSTCHEGCWERFEKVANEEK